MKNRLSLIFVISLMGILSVILTVGVTVILKEERREVLNLEKKRIAVLSEATYESLQTIMLSGNATQVSEWLDELSMLPEVEGAMVLRPDGEPAFTDTSTLDRVNGYLGSDVFKREPSNAEKSFTVSEALVARAVAGERFPTVNTGDRYISYVMPIVKEQRCNRCHGYTSRQVLGVLTLRTSLEWALGEIESIKKTTITFALALLATLGAAVYGLVHFLVIRPIGKITDTVVRMDGGDLHARTGLDRADEIGALARSLDGLADELTTTMVSRDYLDSLFEAVNDALVVVNGEGSIQRVNQTLVRLLGYDRAELIGQNAEMLFPASPPLNINWLDYPEVMADISGIQTEYATSDGSRVPVYFTASHARSPAGEVEGVVLAARDISALKKTEQVLKVSEESFQAIVAKSVDGIIIVDGNGNIKYVNPTAEVLLGRDSLELVGTDFGFPLVEGTSTELDIFRRDKTKGIAEMRIIETMWQGEKSSLVSLRDVTESVQLREKLRRMSTTDKLTGLNNRRGFTSLVDSQLKLMNRTAQTVAVIFIDIDDMKSINDHYGHKAGDDALVETANLLSNTFRDSDVIARVGGDEFVVFAVIKIDGAQANMVERLERELEGLNSGGTVPFTLSLSTGYVTLEPGGKYNIEEVLTQADELMYRQKKKKKGERGRRSAGGSEEEAQGHYPPDKKNGNAQS